MEEPLPELPTLDALSLTSAVPVAVPSPDTQAMVEGVSALPEIAAHPLPAFAPAPAFTPPPAPAFSPPPPPPPSPPASEPKVIEFDEPQTGSLLKGIASAPVFQFPKPPAVSAATPETPAAKPPAATIPSPPPPKFIPPPKVVVPPATSALKETKPEVIAPKPVLVSPPTPGQMPAPKSLPLTPRSPVSLFPVRPKTTEPTVIEAPTTSTAMSEIQRNLPVAPRRLLALDAFRGFIMMLLASTGFGIRAMSEKPGFEAWKEVGQYLEHRLWSGCNLWDLIQPAFMFMAGMSMPFSYEKRIARGDSMLRLVEHALFRSIMLVLIGVFLSSSVKDGATNWSFMNVLSQIGLGYMFLFALWRTNTWTQVVSFLAILGLYGWWFASGPLHPEYAYHFTKNGFQQSDLFTGFFAHWNPHTNVAADFDRWFLNLFPRVGNKPFEINEGGYQTLNFIPSIATMLIGLWAGRFVKSERGDGFKTVMLLLMGVALVVIGYLVGENLCPIVKRIWTPSWVLFSGGLVLLMLGLIYGIVEWCNVRAVGWPFAILGMNSIFIYLAGQLCKGFVKERLALHLYPSLPADFVKTYLPMLETGGFLVVIWLACWWLYRQRAFLRI